MAAISLNSVMRGDIADLIIRAKLMSSSLGFFGVPTPPNLPLSVGETGRSYNGACEQSRHSRATLRLVD